jgi:hypothetical protein
MGSSPDEMAQRGGSNKNGRRLGVERSSGSGTRLWVDDGGSSVQLVGSSPMERSSQLGDAANF